MLYTKKTFYCEVPAEEADVCLIGVPFDSTEIGRSVRYGPVFIREAIKNLVGWDPELKINVFEKLKFCDLGDIEVVPGNWKLTQERISDTVKWMFEANPKAFPGFLGGEHLVTLGILKSLPYEKITVVDFDAHRDLKKDWLGEKFSHVTWASHIIDNPKFDLIQLGCRIWDEDELKHKVKDALGEIKTPVYISVDLDVFDPAHAPEVGTPEPNGLKPEEVFRLLKEACKHKLIGMDIVECASDRLDTSTALLSAQIFKKVLGWGVAQAGKT